MCAIMMDMNGRIIYQSVKYLLRVLPFILMCRCTSGITVLSGKSSQGRVNCARGKGSRIHGSCRGGSNIFVFGDTFMFSMTIHT